MHDPAIVPDTGKDGLPLLLLPSAKLIAVELQGEFGRIPPAMVPLGGRPAYTHIIAPHADKGGTAPDLDVLIAVNEAGGAVEAHLRHTARATGHPRVDVVDVGRTGSLAQTILVALRSRAAIPPSLIINFADTVVGDALAPGTTIAWANARNLFRWTCFTSTPDGRLDQIIERFAPKDGSPPTFVGVFRFERVGEFMDDLQAAIDDPARDMDPFYAALKAHFNRRPANARTLQEVRQWWDLGHLDTYYQTKQAYWINKRFFNDLAIQQGRGVIRKESRDTGKFRDEIRWYLRLPKQLAYLSPRLFDYSLDAFHPWVEMEFYGYPTLNDMYLFGDHDPGFWAQVFDAVAQALDAMATFQVLPSQEEATSALRDMYEIKTRTRLNSLAGQAALAPFFQDSVRINGKTCPGIPRVLAAIPALMAATGLDQAPRLTIIHGDLCLSNILFDARNCAIRVIDPRGSFGPWDIYGDPRYDLAKLSHSIAGDYDLIVNDMVATAWDADGGFRFEPHLTPRHHAVKALFQEWLRRRTGPDGAQAVALIESLLFLSMAPLHADRPQAQRAFIANGLARFDAVARAADTPGWPR